MTRTRRRFVITGAATGLVLGIGGTPARQGGRAPPPPLPARSELMAPGTECPPIALTGSVLDPACKPMAHALLDLWQADDAGDYDNTGFRLRGHQYTDAQGRYPFRPIVPAVYPARPP